jgi:hypothetical protein
MNGFTEIDESLGYWRYGELYLPWEIVRVHLFHHDYFCGMHDGTYWGEWDVFV